MNVVSAAVPLRKFAINEWSCFFNRSFKYTMNNAFIYEVIAINNRCIENVHEGTIAHALSELQVAMRLFKDRATAVLEPIGHEQNAIQALHCNELQFSLQLHQNQIELTSSGVVAIQFSPQTMFSHSCLLSTTSSSPISICQHQLLLVIKNKIHATPSMSMNDLAVESGSVSTEDVQLICATMLYNMAILCHKYAFTGSHNNYCMSSRTTDIIRALKMYELLVNFCNQRNDVPMDHPLNQTHRPYSSSKQMIQIIQLIAYNNYAEICYELGNYAKYKNCMDVLQYHLYSLLSSSWTNDNCNDITGIGSGIIYDELKLNVLTYKLCPTPRLASAA
jgi:hypothetical protein